VIAKAIVPRKLTKDQKKIVEQLGKTMEPEVIDADAPARDEDKPFFEKVKDIFG